MNIDKTAKNTLLLYFGIILNISFGWIIAKLNTNFLSVQDYGKYAFYINAIYFSRVFFLFGAFESTSRLLAIFKEKNDRRELFGATLVLSLFIIALYTLFFQFASPIFDLFKVKITDLGLYFAPIVGFIILQTYLYATLKGSEQIGLLSFSTFSPRFFYIIFLIYIILFADFNLHSTLYAFFYGMGVAVIISLVIIKPRFKNIRKRISQIIEQVKTYGIHMYSGNILSETLFHSDKFVVSFYLDNEAMAYYGLAYMLTFPLSHFSTSLATTLFNRFVSQKEINPKVLKINLIVVAVSVSLFILLRRPIVYHLFSPDYLPSVPVMLPLAIAFGFSGLSKPYVLNLMAQGKGKLVRNIMMVIPTVNIILNLILVPIYGIFGAAWSAFIARLLDYALYMFAYKRSV